MESGLKIRKDIKIFQFLEQFPLKVKLFLLVKESYEDHMEKICENISEDLDVKIHKVLQDVCTNYHEGIINEMNTLMNVEDYSKSCGNCENCKNDNFLKNENDNDFNIVEDIKHSSDSNWPSSLSNNSEESEDDDSYSFMPLKNYEK